jgi:hypothetical protein
LNGSRLFLVDLFFCLSFQIGSQPRLQPASLPDEQELVHDTAILSVAGLR